MAGNLPYACVDTIGYTFTMLASYIIIKYNAIYAMCPTVVKDMQIKFVRYMFSDIIRQSRDI